MKNKILIIIGYVLCILFDAFVAMINYSLFMKTYGKTSFAKGIASVFVFWFPYIIVLIAFTVVFILLMKRFNKRDK